MRTLAVVAFVALMLPLLGSTSLSDEKVYRDACLKAATESDSFLQFKQNSALRRIYLSLPQDKGKCCLEIILRQYPDLRERLAELALQDKVGDATTFSYPPFGDFCPSTLRYIKIAGELGQFCGSLDGKRIVEIGGGFGGQCVVLSKLHAFDEYIIVDLPEALALIERYLTFLGVTNFRCLPPDQIPECLLCDLVISNYALSECSDELQAFYLQRVLRHARHGYLLCNQITEQPTQPRQMIQRLSQNDIRPLLREEVPNTHPGNFLVTW